MKNRFVFAITLLASIIVLAGCQPEPEMPKALEPDIDQEQIYQVSTLNALQAGVYQGEVSFDELQEKGNLGIGTFEALDGEMIMIDGVFYQVRSDGKVYGVKPEMTTPFANVTYYSADEVKTVNKLESLGELQTCVDSLRADSNHFYAIRIDGTFEYIKVRSVPAQSQPYPPLSEAVLGQTVFEYQDVEGSILGFWCPGFVDGINMPGYHFHFISKDRLKGGHLLDARVIQASIGVDFTDGFSMHLPVGEAFSSSNLNEDQSQALEKAER